MNWSVEKPFEPLKPLYDGLFQSKSDDVLSFEEIVDVEKIRFKLNEKVRNFSETSMAKSFRGTVLPHIIRSRQAWLVVCEYVVLRVLLKYEIIVVGDDVPNISGGVTSVIGGFMSFFLVFFVSQAYSRFMAQYDISMRIEGRVSNLSFLARNTLPPAEALRLVRYANAAHILGYIGVSEAYTFSNIFRPMNEKYRLLTESEVDRLNAIGMKKGACMEVLVWMMDLVYDQRRVSNDSTNKEANIYPMDVATLQMLSNEVLLMRGTIGSLYDFAEQSIPFTYMHLLVLINGAYLILMAYTIATFMPISHSVFPDLAGAFLLATNLIFVIGMIGIGRHMIDPYGHDVSRFSRSILCRTDDSIHTSNI